MVGNRRQGWALYARDGGDARGRAIAVAYGAEQNGSPAQKAPRSPPLGDGTTGGNLEGKEQRFGIANSALWAGVTTAASNGSVNSAHDSLHRHRRRRPAREHDDRRGHLRRGRLGALRDAAVRPAGGVHRRPDGRAERPSTSARRSRRARSSSSLIGTLAVPLARARHHGAGDRHASTARPRSSTRARRASPRRSTPTPRRATTTARRSPATRASCSRTRPATRAPSGSPSPTCSAGSRCSFGRFVPLLAALAVAGSLAAQARLARRRRARSAPTRPTFVVLLIGVIVLVAALTFFPALLLGPIVQGLTDQLF